MKVLFIGVLVLGTTALLLLLRSLLVRGTSAPNQRHRVYLMRVSDGGDEKQDPNDEWPSVVGTEESSASNVRELSEDDRIQLAIMEEQIFRFIR